VRSTILRAGLGDGDYLVYWISGEPGKRAAHFGEETFSVSGSTPCQPAGSATPPAEECIADPPTGEPAAPIVVDGISVTLDISNDQAGPVDLAATVTDTAGAPIEGATVVFRARHLEMNQANYRIWRPRSRPASIKPAEWGWGWAVIGGWRSM
jgi:hypothetical protein